MKTTGSSGHRAPPGGPRLDPHALEAELKQLIIDALKLEEVTPADIDTDAPLFFEGLGLDSMDGLELGIAVERRYGVHFDEAAEENAARFASVRTLAAFIANQPVQ
jgi:acyl carrier protein